MSKPVQRAPSRRTGWILAGCALLLVAVWWRRDAWADRLFPAARAQALERRAQQALDAGRLSRADGEGARELYEAAIAIDPDRLPPRQGLARVATQALADAEYAIERGGLDEARRSLALAEALEAPRDRIALVAERLRLREVARLRSGDLLQRAARARREGRLDGEPTAALPIYAQVLAADPRNLSALEGREDALDDLLNRAQENLHAGRLAEAAAAIAAARGYDPGHEALPAAEDALQQATDALPVQAARSPTADDARVREATRALQRPVSRARNERTAPATGAVRSMLQQARVARLAGRLTQPAGNSAVHWLRQALDVAPRDARVGEELRMLDLALQRCQRAALPRNALARAGACLDGRMAIAGDDARFADARRRLAERWLAVGEERLRGGDVVGAHAAWEAARRRDAGVPGLQAFARRLRTAERALR